MLVVSFSLAQRPFLPSSGPLIDYWGEKGGLMGPKIGQRKKERAYYYAA